MLVWGALSADRAAAGEYTARQILDYYLSLPCPDDDPMEFGRSERVQALQMLWSCPEEATAAIGERLPEIQRRVHRLELIEMLGRLRAQGSGETVVPYFYDDDPEVRLQALKSLRLMASRIRRAGVINVPAEPQFPPAVDGLMPYLIEAANDEDPGVRSLAMWALADTREPEAAEELRRHLSDPDPGIRFRCACLLAEFGDDSGLPELRIALDRLAEKHGETGTIDSIVAEHLFVSLERVTGANLGTVPMNPLLASSFGRMEQLSEEYEALLLAWVDWWAEFDRTDGADGTEPRNE
jgi:hypothetical protein